MRARSHRHELACAQNGTDQRAVAGRVEADQALVVMEAMKMQTTLRADNAGVVTAVMCSPDQLVDDVMPLVRLGPTE